jgi:hypothetical protein
LVLGEHSCDAFLGIARHEAVTDYFVKFHSLIPFDAFNGSLVEQCLIHLAGFKLVIHSRIQGKGKENHQKGVNWWSPVWPVTSTGLTGVNAASAFGWVTRHLCPGDPVRLCMLQGDPTPMAGWPGVDLTFKKKGDLVSKVMRDSTHFN